MTTHRFGGVELGLGDRAIGHLHGDKLVDLRSPVKVLEELVAVGRARQHHVLPESDWIGPPLRGTRVSAMRQKCDG